MIVSIPADEQCFPEQVLAGLLALIQSHQDETPQCCGHFGQFPQGLHVLLVQALMLCHFPLNPLPAST